MSERKPRGRPKKFTEEEQEQKKKDHKQSNLAKSKSRLYINKKEENARLLKHLQEGKSAETFNFQYLNVNLDKTIENSYTTLI